MSELSKDERLTFSSMRECVDDLDAKVARTSYGLGRRTKERQTQCARCWRWKYLDERCNLFSTVKP